MPFMRAFVSYFRPVKKHSKICYKLTKLNFPGGFHSSPKTIFEKLAEIGIPVEKSLQHYPWLIVYDMEALLLTSETKEQSIWKTEHRPVSVCINSNVPEFEDVKFIFEPKEEKLVQRMIEYMYQISDKAYELAQSRWKCVFDAFEKLEAKWNSEETVDEEYHHTSHTDNTCAESNYVEPASKEFKRAISKENVYYGFMKRLQSDDTLNVRYNDWTEGSDNDEEGEDNGDENDVPTDKPKTDKTVKRLMNKLIAKYKEEFQTYCRRAVCIGFNSGKYDINLLRKTLIKQLGMHLKNSSKYVIIQKQ